MKNIIAIIIVFVFCSVTNQMVGQSVNLESTIKVDKTGTLLSTQRVEVKNSTFTLKFDYKANGNDVLGIIIPKIWSNSTSSLSGMIVKIGDGNSNDQFAFDIWGNRKFGKLATMLEIRRIVSPANKPWNFIGTRLSYGNFTAEAYAVSKYQGNQGKTKKGPYYSWIAYHPSHAFVAIGKQDRQYGGYAGTKGLSRFGNFTFVNYQPDTKNFWFKSQTAFGNINQKFFCQETYILATSYLTVPLFYYIHFSPIVTKGTLTLKVEGRQTAGFQNYEVMMGKQLNNNLFGFAVGINSEYNKDDLNLSPSFELYKSWKNNIGQCIIELRYDHLHRVCSAFLAIKY
ncbi:MAG TPA: hypothetical protein VFD51_01750 [Patescibacteria group bacterium]|nr:hypothetical protein [Patescibacteria group bacterium]